MSMIGELVVGIIGDSSGLKTAMTQATTMVGDQATQMESAVTKSFVKIGTIMAGAFSAQKVLQFVGDSITAYSTFETATTRIFAEMGDASQETRDQIIADIRQISDAYNINLSTVAAGVNEALDVKVPPEQLANFMAMAAQLSKVSEIDLSTSVRSLGQLVTLADGDYSNIGPLADALFQISESTGAGIGEISGQLGKIVPFASALGVDLNQIAAAMMTMGEQGVPARTGLSGIQSIIEELSNMGEGSLGTLFASLTGSTFQEFLANGGTLSTALEQIATWAEASNTPLTQFFASASSGNAAIALTGTHTAALAANLEAVKSGAAGVASVWDELSRTMQEKSRDMSTKVDAVKVDLGGMVKAVLDPLNEIATGILSSITGLLGSIVSLLRGDFASAWNGLKQFFTGIYDAILGVFNLAGLGDAVDKGLKQATDSFMRFLGSVGQWGANIIQSLNDGLAAAWHTVVEWFANAWDSLISALTSWMPGFMKSWLGIGQDAGAQLAQGLTDSTSVVSEAAEGIGQTIGDSVTTAMEQTAEDFSASVSAFLSGGLTDGAMEAQTAASDVGYSIGEGLSLGITSSASLVSDAVTTLGEGAIFDLETTFGSKSPSRVMWEIGRDVVRGLVGGIE
jgi:TP901 family phage tail tape measure protein